MAQFSHIAKQLGYLLLLVCDDFVQLLDQVFSVGCLYFQIRQTLVDDVEFCHMVWSLNYNTSY